MYKLSTCLINYLGYCLTGLLLVCWLPSVKATHIVGGEMTYTCLGDDLYEIQLTIYRDCFFGNPNAYFDDPASIGVFDQNNLLIQDIRVDLMGDDTLSQVLTDECLVVPPSVCVHTTTYRVIAELPPIIGGYQLAYQRCCRNQTIANIIEPLATGATFGVTISERALLECNSSAKFLQWPPLYICANEPIFFDQSAADEDGDSIVYRLCTPLQGADQDIPRPQPPNNPPYLEVNWNDPPYNTDNMLNGIPGGQPLQIDPVTGLLTGVPNTIGQFVVGICAEEYRNGELISTTRRDFQYNVGVCGQIMAAFFTPEIQCDGLEVNFNNESLGANNFEWYFGGLDMPLGVSTDINPSFVFPDTGQYEIVLIAEPNEFCRDTFRQSVHLLPNSLFASFTVDTLACGDSLSLQLTDTTFDTLSNPQSWEWSINGEFFSNELNPNLVLTEIGEYEIQLSVTAENGCQSDTVFNINGLAFIQEELANDSLLICPGDSVFLNISYDESYTYEWAPAESLNDPSAPNPLAFPIINTTYSLLVSDTLNGCTAERSIHVEVSEDLVIAHTEDLTTCSDSVFLEASSNNGIRYFWATDLEFTTNVVEGESFWANPIGEQTYYLQVINAAGCNVIDSVIINSQAVNIEPSTQDTAICLGTNLVLSLFNFDPDYVLSFNWTPDDAIIVGQNTTAIGITFPTPGEYFVGYEVSNQYGCLLQDSIQVIMVDTVQLEASLSYQQCMGNRIQFSSSHPFAALYQWHFNDPESPNAQAEGAEVSHEYGGPGEYEVLLTLPGFLDCWDTLRLPITVLPQGSISPGFLWDYQTCSDTALIELSNNTQTSGTTLVALEWWLSGELLGTVTPTEFVAYEDELYTVQLITYAENGCIDTLTEILEIPLIPFELADSIQVCPNEAVFLYPGADSSYDYQWSPATYLDDPISPNPEAVPLQNIVYSLQINDPNSICQREGQIVVQVPEAINYDLVPDITSCEEQFLLYVESEQNLTFEWSDDTSFLNILNTEEEWLTDVIGEEVFYTRMTDVFGCSIIDSVAVNSHAIQLFIDPEQTICLSDTLQLEAIATGGENITFQWSPAEEIIGPSDTSAILVSPLETTSFSLSVSNGFGCQTDTIVQVNIFNFSPPLDVIPEIDTIFLGESVALMATDRPGYIYEWTPNIGLSETDVFNPFATPEETTTYQVTIRDANGCTNTATALIVVLDTACERPYIFVPNAFTPNGDLLNDEWGVEGNVIESIHLMVYDRWGELVFESFSQDDKWDGMFKEKPLSSDVFGYYLEINCIGGERFIEKGNVSLIR